MQRAALAAGLVMQTITPDCNKSCRHMQVPPFKATLMESMPFIDFLFGNETEAAAFAASEG